MMFEEERKKYKGLVFVGFSYAVPDWEVWSWEDVDEWLKEHEHSDTDDEDEKQDILNEMADDCGGNFSNFSYFEPSTENLQSVAGFLDLLRETIKEEAK